MAAKKILRRIVGIPAADVAAAFLSDTLDWLNLWTATRRRGGEVSGDYHDAGPNHLSPHL